jgi:tRNA(fMet)-specific endonuclease VapC
VNAGTLAYLLDTGWIVRHLRGQRAYTESIASRASEGLAVSVISVAELQEGVALATDRERAVQSLATFLSTVTVLPVEEETSRIFGNLSTGLRRKGNHPGDFDTLIAATATPYELTLLTTDGDDFSPFDGLTLVTAP